LHRAFPELRAVFAAASPPDPARQQPTDQ